VSIPGIIGGIPGMSMPACSWWASASGTVWRRSPSQRCIIAISSVCATTIRSARIRTSARASWLTAQPAMTMACAWWPIIPCMNFTSADVYGGRPLSALACSAGVGPLVMGRTDWEGDCWVAALHPVMDASVNARRASLIRFLGVELTTYGRAGTLVSVPQRAAGIGK